MKATIHRKLLIGVSGASARHPSVRAMLKQIRDEGFSAQFLTSRVRHVQGAVEKDSARIDALVVMGNDWDIDPKQYLHRYAEDDPKRQLHAQTRSELATPKGKARARYEEQMLKKALSCGMPVLGICGGMQRLNVLCGGTLHQHIPDLVGCNKHMQQLQGIAPHRPAVAVIIKENTLLADIARPIKMPFSVNHSPLQPKVIMENSMHHQAMDKIAPELRVCAMTDTVRLSDGCHGYLAEAIEADPHGAFAGQFILGVQWHPEYGASSLGQRIVQQLGDAAQVFSQKRQRRHVKQKLAFMRVTSVEAFHGKA